MWEVEKVVGTRQVIRMISLMSDGSLALNRMVLGRNGAGQLGLVFRLEESERVSVDVGLAS
jgi:hypothetical protein